jgi:hypothetical protein
MSSPANRSRSRHPRGRRALPTRAVACAFGLVATLLTFSSEARAEKGRGVRVFPELGTASFSSEQGGYGVVGFRAASVSPNQPSADFALAAWLVPAVVLTSDLALAYPIGVGPDVRLVPRIGGTALIVGGGDFLGFGVGPNFGLGLVLNARGPVLVRIDGTARVLAVMDEDSLESMNSLTVGIAW